jgi:hypothetical protein
LQAPFLVAAAVLATAAFVVGPIVLAGGATEYKEPLPLKRPLGQMTKEKLGPYRLPAEGGTQILNAAVVDTLGTTEYVSRIYIDESVTDRRSPLAVVHLLVTYYTGGRDLVPHTPDQCYYGAGYQPIKMENLEVEVPTVGGRLPLRVLTFIKSALFGKEEPTVGYTFHCNGRFCCTRTEVRYLIQSPTEKHAYFCKIEVSFGGPDSQPAYPTREEAVQATAKFLDHVLPVLLRDHLPDWPPAAEAGPSTDDDAAAGATGA